jgi:hypothetical protein
MRVIKENIEFEQEMEEKLLLTPFGLISLYIDQDNAKLIADKIELYLRRHDCGIAIDDNKLRFVKIAEVGK